MATIKEIEMVISAYEMKTIVEESLKKAYPDLLKSHKIDSLFVDSGGEARVKLAHRSDSYFDR
jgi:hypothetical protein